MGLWDCGGGGAEGRGERKERRSTFHAWMDGYMEGTFPRNDTADKRKNQFIICNGFSVAKGDWSDQAGEPLLNGGWVVVDGNHQ